MAEAAERVRELRGRCLDRGEFAAELRALRDVSSLEVRAAGALLRGTGAVALPLAIHLVSSYTTELLAPYLEFHALLHGFEPRITRSPFGQLVQPFLQPVAPDVRDADFLVVLLEWSDLDPELAGPLHGLAEDARAALAARAIASLERLLASAARAGRGTVVASLLRRDPAPGLGLYDPLAPSSETLFRAVLLESAARAVRERLPGVHLDCADHLLASLGARGAFDERLWHSSRFPFSTRGALLFAERLMRFPVLARTPRVKCIVLDADGTLWGGIVGEDGPEGIALGPSYPGSCYTAFQRRLLDFLHRGIVLALCSRNERDDVLEVLRTHPHMVLREGHFAALCIDWSPKPQGIASIAAELNLGLDALLFVDDSPQECRAMRQMRPEVRVVRTPAKPLEVPACLDHLQELEVAAHTAEDRGRAHLYATDRRRREAALACSSLEEHLASLGMQMRISFDDSATVARVAQLTQRTNQFNLTGRRYTEAQIAAFCADPSDLVACFGLADAFGDSGLVGAALVRGVSGARAELDSFLLSCRVLGRKAEEVFLRRVLAELFARGVREVSASYVPTKRNAQVARFWLAQGFEESGGGCYRLALCAPPAEHSLEALFRVVEARASPR